MKNLITGGAGFIGSHLAEKLVKNGEEVVIIDNLSTGSRDNIKNLTANYKFFKASAQNIITDCLKFCLIKILEIFKNFV